ncbi:MAG: sulfur transferase domain-containing protein [Myxococcales bacterium]|nr:sulfur transferase domain-containing protein [Myxococcales bacterium]
MRLQAPAVLALLLATALACGGGEAARPAAESAEVEPSAGGSATAPLEIPNAAQPLPQVTTGGQPSDEQLSAAREQGYRTVISLRTEGEQGSEGERAKVEALGMVFVSIPVAGADDLSEENARRLAEALAADDAKPAIVHCGSGNRAGALLSMKAFLVDGASAEEALALGKRAGLTKLEAAVRERLGLP